MVYFDADFARLDFRLQKNYIVTCKTEMNVEHFFMRLHCIVKRIYCKWFLFLFFKEEVVCLTVLK